MIIQVFLIVYLKRIIFQFIGIKFMNLIISNLMRKFQKNVDFKKDKF